MAIDLPATWRKPKSARPITPGAEAWWYMAETNINADRLPEPVTKSGIVLTWGEHERDGRRHTEWHAPCGCAFHPKPTPHWHPCIWHRNTGSFVEQAAFNGGLANEMEGRALKAEARLATLEKVAEAASKFVREYDFFDTIQQAIQFGLVEGKGSMPRDRMESWLDNLREELAALDETEKKP